MTDFRGLVAAALAVQEAAGKAGGAEFASERGWVDDDEVKRLQAAETEQRNAFGALLSRVKQDDPAGIAAFIEELRAKVWRLGYESTEKSATACLDAGLDPTTASWTIAVLARA